MTQLSLLRNLRFKQFFVAVMSHALEALLGRRVDRETVAFTIDESNAKKNSLLALTAAWTPIAEKVIAFICTELTADDFAVRLAEDDALDETVARKVSALIYAARDSMGVESFTRIVQ